METEKSPVTVQTEVQAPLDKVWDYFTKPEHLVKWNNASDEWHTPHAENDLRVGGKFLSRMAAKDGSASFDFSGVYDEVTPKQLIAYSLADGRKVKINFAAAGDNIHISETFDTENTHPPEIQKAGWQAILDNFKKYTEGN